jgi:hypothetical protein
MVDASMSISSLPVAPLLTLEQLNEILEASSPPSSATVQSMSSAFEPHLGVFVDAQDKSVFASPHIYIYYNC